MGSVDHVQHNGLVGRRKVNCEKEQQHFDAVYILSGHVNGWNNTGTGYDFFDDGRSIGVSVQHQHLDVILVEFCAVDIVYVDMLFYGATLSGNVVISTI